MRFLLTGLASSFWSATSALARWASQTGWLKKENLGVKVISVGNLQVGGAGKTPLVAQIAREAGERGLKVCILTRGYKSQWEAVGGFLTPGGAPGYTPQCGDEAALLHDLCPDAYLGIGANRIKQFRELQATVEAPFDLVILDDGFQNYRIHKDLEVVALTSARPWQILFRDRVDALKSAHLLVWTKGRQRPETLGKPSVRIRYQLPPPVTTGSLWLVTGIAEGRSAYNLAIKVGYRIDRHISLGDHYAYDKATVDGLLLQANAGGAKIALTGKDWVKWRDLGVASSKVVILEPELVFEEGRAHWSRVLWGE